MPSSKLVVSGCRWVLGTVLSAAFEYDTPKIVHIKNWKVGVMNRFFQLCIVGYIIGYAIIYQKGYQDSGPVLGVVTTKMKGASVFNASQADFLQNCNGTLRPPLVFDVADYVIPPQEPNGFFVMTNQWVTCDQSFGVCAEDPSVLHSHCNNTYTPSLCLNRTVLPGGNGQTTGECVPVEGGGVSTCQVEAWCPTENENKTVTERAPVIKNAKDFTVLIKNSVQFPSLSRTYRRRNILKSDNTSFLDCRFNPNDPIDLYCPIFSLGWILDQIQDTDFNTIAIQGGVIGIDIEWNCDLDRHEGHCDPKYTFRRLDDPKVAISPGFNFRYAKYWFDGGVEHRTLIKAYGILFKVQVTGLGGKFSFITLVLKLGSMIALLALASVLSDLLVLYVFKKGFFYRGKKYQIVNASQEEEQSAVNSRTESCDNSEKEPLLPQGL